MTTFELPPEPPIGSRVRDASGREWVSDANVGWKSGDESREMIVGWALLMGYHGPLTLIEPDPWPTAPLIVADWTSGGVEGGRGLLYRETDADQYWTVRENESVYLEHSGDALTNVVPVKPVPVAELDALTVAIRDHGVVDCYSEVVALLEATDRLGLDQ